MDDKRSTEIKFSRSWGDSRFKHSKPFKIAHANKCAYIKSQAETLQRKSRMQLLLSLYHSLPSEMINTFRSGIQCIDNGTEVDFSSCFEYDSDNDDSDGESYDGIESTSSTISHNFLEEDK